MKSQILVYPTRIFSCLYYTTLCEQFQQHLFLTELVLFFFSSKQKECLTLCLWKCLSSLAINPRVTLYKNKGNCTHCVRPCFYFAYTLRLILPTEVHSLTSQYSSSCGAKAPRSGDALRACGLELSH